MYIQLADSSKKFKRAWLNFSSATELNKKPEPVQVATLLTVVGEEAREVFATFIDWAEEGDDEKIAPVLDKFAAYCEPRKVFRLRGIVLINGLKSLGNLIRSILQHCEN